MAPVTTMAVLVPPGDGNIRLLGETKVPLCYGVLFGAFIAEIIGCALEASGLGSRKPRSFMLSFKTLSCLGSLRKPDISL